MKIKMLKNHETTDGKLIKQGEVFEARQMRNFFHTETPSFQIIDNELSGEIIPWSLCVMVEEDKIYTEKAFNDMENYYLDLLEKEREKKTPKTTNDLSKLLNDVNNFIHEKNVLIEQLEMKNKELEEKVKEKANINITMFSIDSNIDPEEIERKLRVKDLNA